MREVKEPCVPKMQYVQWETFTVIAICEKHQSVTTEIKKWIDKIKTDCKA